MANVIEPLWLQMINAQIFLVNSSTKDMKYLQPPSVGTSIGPQMSE